MEATKNIRLRRLHWVGYVMTKDERVPKKALKGYIKGRRLLGRPRGRWMNAMDRDTKRMLKCKKWRRLAGGGGLKRPRLKLGCSAIGEETYCYEYIFAARNV